MNQSIAQIELKGEPYQTETLDCTKTLAEIAANADYKLNLRQLLATHSENLQTFEKGYYAIESALTENEHLNFEQSFSAITYVSAALNNVVYELTHQTEQRDLMLLHAENLLTTLSNREIEDSLSAEEIAGMVAGTLTIDTLLRVSSKDHQVFGIGGMGGDKGYSNGRDSKLFNVSTLSSFVLANVGTVHKHHSFGNTSIVGGQNYAHELGASSSQNTLEAFQYLQNQANLLMSSAHTFRLIHTLSHKLRRETVNHIIGPLSIPIDSEIAVNGIFGVNHNIHPSVLIDALKILSERGIQNYGNSVAFCGLDAYADAESLKLINPDLYYRNKELRNHIRLDEVAPPPYSTLASFLIEGENIGTFVITPEDFIPAELRNNIDFEKIFVARQRDKILAANMDALTGRDISKSYYVAMNAGLHIFTKKFTQDPRAFIGNRLNPEVLQLCFKEALGIIEAGRAQEKAAQYVRTSNEALRFNLYEA